MKRIHVRRSGWVSLAGVGALLLALALTMGVSGQRALAQSGDDPSANAAPLAINVDKVVSAARAMPGDTLLYTITIHNDAATTVSARLTDTLPAGLSLVAPTLTTYVSGSHVVYEDGMIKYTHDMPALSSDYITFQAEVSSSVTNTTIVNTAEATAGSSYAEDSAVTQVRQAGDQYIPLYLELWPPHYYLPLTLRRYPVRLTLDPIPAPSAAHTYQVSWSWPDGIVAPYDHYVLQQSRTPNFLTVTQVWTTTVQSQLINYTYCPYYYRVRADSAADWGVGAWSVVQAAQASPPKPVLNAIPAPDGNGSFTVSWMPIPGYTPDQYVLQESATSDFASVTEWVVTGTSKLIEKGTNVGTWYYRVRADASCWGQGPWSDARSTTTLYYDDFSNSASGWPVYARLVIPETETHYRARYENGHYRIMVDPGGPLIWFHQPDAFAPYRPPTNKYCVETRVRLHKMYPPYDNPNWDYFPFWANGGLVFGANEENTNLYALCVTVGTDALNKIGWMIVNNPTYQFPRMGCNYTPGVKGGESSSLRTIDWHLFQVGVDGDQASVYIDGAYKGTFNMPGLSLTTRVGLIGGDYEVTPTDFHFDFFKVTPNVACGPVP